MHHFTSKTIEELFSNVWDQGRVDALDDAFGEGFVRVNTGSGESMTKDEFKQQVLTIREGMPDLKTSVDNVVVEGDRLVTFWSTEGTHTGTLYGVPPTGQKVRTSGCNLMTIKDDKIVREDVTWDNHELLKSLGVRTFHDTRAALAGQTTADPLRDPSPELLKGFNRQFVTGVTVVTTTDSEDKPRGLAVSSYASISLEPPLVLICVQRTSSTYPALFESSHLGINILAASQGDVVASFAKSGHDKFAGIQWHKGPDGSPLIDGSAACLEAEIRDRFQAQTHTMFVCRVRHTEVNGDDPMIYRAGKFFHSNNLTPLTPAGN